MQQCDISDVKNDYFYNDIDPWCYCTSNYIIHYPVIFSQVLIWDIMNYEVYIPDLPMRITFPGRTLEEAKRETKEIVTSWLKTFPNNVSPPSSMEKIKQIAEKRYTIYTIESIYIDVEEDLY